MRRSVARLERRAVVLAAWAAVVGAIGLGGSVTADEPSAEAINARLHQALDSAQAAGRIETVSGQMYLSRENIDAIVIGEALAALLDPQRAGGQAVAVQLVPRLNFEIHFRKNSADLDEASRASLDALGEVLGSEAYHGMRFVLGGHTDQDGDDYVNEPLSQARAESARGYLVREHAIAEDRLVAQGFGAAEPLREVEKNAQDKLYNRRVDLRLMR